VNERSPIEEHYRRFGGPGGLLGAPIGDEEDVGDVLGGRRRSFRAELIGVEHRLSVPIPDGPPDSTCDEPDTGPRTVVDSTVTWSPRTGAHAVHGEIRRRWLELGAETGELGYPLSDEHDAPDDGTRRTVFQRGEIRWTRDGGVDVRRRNQAS
jgi:uncharacterized protein with LGFP repeats